MNYAGLNFFLKFCATKYKITMNLVFNQSLLSNPLLSIVGRGGRVGRAQVSKSRGPGFNPTDAVSNLGQVRLPHVALV